jgi:hypothetical protein
VGGILAENGNRRLKRGKDHKRSPAEDFLHPWAVSRKNNTNEYLAGIKEKHISSSMEKVIIDSDMYFHQ